MKKDKKQKTLQRIMEYMKPYRFLIFASLVLAVISVALTLYVPILTGQGVDCIISKENVDFARLISIIKHENGLKITTTNVIHGLIPNIKQMVPMIVITPVNNCVNPSSNPSVN